MLIVSVVGARPNFMKMAPVVRALQSLDCVHRLVHTGQHYDDRLSGVFARELELPAPDVHLDVGSGTHGRQTARIMERFEATCEEHEPDLVVVAGDVNSTLACALVAAKAGVAVAHVEAGLRSWDRTMPEEINRIVTDQVSDLLFTTEASANQNLIREGIPSDRIHFVGNCMVDTLRLHLDRALAGRPWRDLGVAPGGYGLVTLHRPSNVDDPATLSWHLESLGEVARQLPLLFSVHPRSARNLGRWGLTVPTGVRVVDSLPYSTFLGLMAKAAVVLTDSGGVQEETSALGIPCLTLRANTERPVTLTEGTNRLVGSDRAAMLQGVAEVLRGEWKPGSVPELWDGRAAQRIAGVVAGWLGEAERTRRRER